MYSLEVLTTVMSSSVGHILETLSYQGGVVMTRWTCDHVPVTDLDIDYSSEPYLPSTEKDDHSIGSGLKQRHKSALFSKAPEEYLGDFRRNDMPRIIANLVDIEYGISGYLRVEAVVDAFNHSFGMMIPLHQFVYLLMLTFQGFSAIQYFSSMSLPAVCTYLVVIVLFIARMLMFLPAMGNLDHRSDSFIDSWMEGLRYVPKGKQSYELYWYKIKSCRLLDFRTGRFFNMERQTCLEFLFRVSEFVIVLLQISY